MVEFGLALAVFFLSHAIPTQHGIRDRLIALLGRSVYLGLYSLMSIGLLAWIISAAWRAPHVALWEPQAWQAAIAVILVPVGLFFIAAGAISPNPLSVTFRSSGFRDGNPGIASITRHPVLWGLALWGFSHTIANGDLVGVVLFGTQTVFAVAGTWLVDRRAQRRLGMTRWRELAADTSNLPFAAILRGNWYSPDPRQAVALIIAGVVSLALLGGLHAWLFGMDPLVWWM